MSWRTAFPARRVVFEVRRAGPPRRTDPEGFGSLSGSGRTRFRLTLRPPRPAGVTRLVIVATDFTGRHEQRVSVPVTR